MTMVSTMVYTVLVSLHFISVNIIWLINCVISCLALLSFTGMQCPIRIDTRTVFFIKLSPDAIIELSPLVE